MNLNNLDSNTIPISFVTPEVAGIKISSREQGGTQEFSTSACAGEAAIRVQSPEVGTWSDARLISSVRCDPPDEAALDVLVARYWDSLFARCHMLTLNHEKALDLAQAAWCRLLQNRYAIKPDGNFPAYLNMIATNLFRDSYRAAHRAGAMAHHQLSSLHALIVNDDGESVFLENVLPDLNTMSLDSQIRLKMDIDTALERLTPLLREVLVARFIEGESCAEIGIRHGRTEQTVSGWVREALRQMKVHLEESDLTPDWKPERIKAGNTSATVAFSDQECPA